MDNLFITIDNATEEEKKKFVNTAGITMLGLAEHKASFQIAEELKLETWQVEANIDEFLWMLRKSLGWKRYIRALFIK